MQSVQLIGLFGLLALAVGCSTTVVSGPLPPEADKLVGQWAHYSTNGNRTEEGHYRIEIQGSTIMGIWVTDKNHANEIKGEERIEFRAGMTGRTLSGPWGHPTGYPFRFLGIVTPQWDEINCKVWPKGEENSPRIFVLRRD